MFRKAMIALTAAAGLSLALVAGSALAADPVPSGPLAQHRAAIAEVASKEALSALDTIATVAATAKETRTTLENNAAIADAASKRGDTATVGKLVREGMSYTFGFQVMAATAKAAVDQIELMGKTTKRLETSLSKEVVEAIKKDLVNTVEQIHSDMAASLAAFERTIAATGQSPG
jgi:hypothetical protein